MKSRVQLVTMLMIFLALLTAGCYKDVISPGTDPNGPPAFVSFSGDLIPLFNSHCNGTGCHDAVPAHAPSLVPDKAYNALTTGGFVNTVAPDQSTIYVVVHTGTMPPTGALKASDAQMILDWIRNGAPNN